MADYTGPDRRYNRDRLKPQPMKGFYLTEPLKLTQLAAPLDTVDPTGAAISGRVAIQAGMVVLLESATSAYVGGTAVTNTTPGFRNCVEADQSGFARPFISWHDYDSHDAIQSGQLVGLDCSDKYELMTPWFDETLTYARGDALTFGAGGKLTNATASGDTIVGHVISVGANANGSHPYNGKTPGATFTDMLHIVTDWTRAEVPS